MPECPWHGGTSVPPLPGPASPVPATADTFAVALRTAITASGMGLTQLRQRLGQRGLRVSTATLSYWQSGRSEPGRRSSVAVVSHLEDILGVPPDSLRTHLARSSMDSTTAVCVPTPVLPARIEQLRARLAPTVTSQSEHHTARVDTSGTVVERTVRSVLMARVAGADRLVVMHRRASRRHPIPALEPVAHCHPGTVHQDPDTTWDAQELYFDRILQPGESIIVEYRECDRSDPTPSYHLEAAAVVPELVLEVRFEPDKLLTSCDSCHITREEPGSVTGRLTPDSSHAVRMIRHTAPPGIYGFRWPTS